MSHSQISRNEAYDLHLDAKYKDYVKQFHKTSEFHRWHLEDYK